MEEIMKVKKRLEELCMECRDYGFINSDIDGDVDAIMEVVNNGLTKDGYFPGLIRGEIEMRKSEWSYKKKEVNEAIRKAVHESTTDTLIRLVFGHEGDVYCTEYCDSNTYPIMEDDWRVWIRGGRCHLDTIIGRMGKYDYTDAINHDMSLCDVIVESV